MLGIIFGVSSVIAMLSIGEGASRAAQEQIKALGTNNILARSVKPADEGNANQSKQQHMAKYGLTYKDAERIATTIPNVKVIVPQREKREQAVRDRYRVEVRVVGTVPWHTDVAGGKIIRGRFLSWDDMRAKKTVCVLGATVAERLYPSGVTLGSFVRLGSQYYRVVGVLAPRGMVDTGGKSFDSDSNRDVYIPRTTLVERYGKITVDSMTGNFVLESVELHQITVEVKETIDVEPTSLAVRAVLDAFHPKKDFELLVPLRLLEQARETRRIFNIVLSSIAAISLLVGGIGIMNIMLATVTERTREIGIRRALGAKRRHIVAQFLAETIVLSILGGLFGVILGVATPAVVTRFANLPTVVTPGSVISAFGISALVGVIFGLYPAERASRMDPIEALRHE